MSYECLGISNGTGSVSQQFINGFARFPAENMMVLNPEGSAMTTKTETRYDHLEPRPGSNYRQLFLDQTPPEAAEHGR